MRLRIGPGPLIQTLTLKQIMTEFNSSRDHIGLLRRSIRLIFRLVLLTLGPIVVVGAGGYFYSTGGRFITTDNAYVKADKIFVSPEVSGPLVEVAVSENTPVLNGQTLIRIDDMPFRIAVSRANARLSAVERTIKATQAHYREEIAVKEAAEEKVAYFQREFGRREELQERGVSSEAALDQARHDLDLARQAVRRSVQKIAQISAYLGGDSNRPVEKHPEYLEALTEQERAVFEISRTVIKAPTDGVVTSIGLQPGEYVTAGEPLFGIVASGEVWVDANLKETKLTHVRVGQMATLRVDAYPEITWRALVASIGAATGSEFSILPPQNATGNWVKIVQRVPIRLMLLDYAGEPPLRAGMSVVVSIDTEHQRQVPKFLAGSLARFGLDQLWR